MVLFKELWKKDAALVSHWGKDSIRFNSLHEATQAMRIIKNKMGLACALNEDKETLRNLRFSDVDYRKMRK